MLSLEYWIKTDERFVERRKNLCNPDSIYDYIKEKTGEQIKLCADIIYLGYERCLLILLLFQFLAGYNSRPDINPVALSDKGTG